MPAKTTYYAIVDSHTSREAPAVYSGALKMTRVSTTRRSATIKPGPEAGAVFLRARKRRHQFYEITEEEADRIVERIRRSVTGQP